MMDQIKLEAIGYLKTDYLVREGTPAQGYMKPESKGKIIVKEKYTEGLLGLEAGDLITIVFYFDGSMGYDMHVVPYGESETVGVFATRSPDRPNGIGISTVRITNIVKDTIEFSGADMLNGSPVLDIKPTIGDVYDGQ